MSKMPFLSRAAFARLTTPTARACLRLGLTPDVVTILGTIVAVAGALTLFPMGKLFAGACVVWFFVLFDMLDGAMARERGGGTRFGAVLDATCDRVSDGAVFCGLLWWIVFGLHDKLLDYLGRLKFQTSYSQNVLQHSIEVAYLTGLIAEEIGLNGALGRRCGLLRHGLRDRHCCRRRGWNCRRWRRR